MTDPVLVVVAGPIAAGKTTVARALARRIRDDGGSVALVGLDEIAAMALPSLPDWEIAHRVFASVVGEWLASGVEYVIADGPGSAPELERVLRSAPVARPIVVLLTSSFATAFERAVADETRGVSRQRDFLAREYDRWQQDEPRVRRDLLVDTGTTSVDDGVARILEAMRD